MIVTCPGCNRRFNLPLNLVRSRNAKLKCSKCKATFVQDLGELIGVASAKLTKEEERFIASLPAAPPRPPPVPEPHLAEAPRAPVASPAAPPPALVIDGYESFAEQPARDSEHDEALARAEKAQAELEAAQRAADHAEAAARTVQATAIGSADIDASSHEATHPAAAEQAGVAAGGTEPQHPDVPTGMTLERGTAPAPARRRLSDEHRRALEMFGAVTPCAPVGLAPTVAADDPFELSDEERAGPWRWLGLGTTVVLLLGLAAFLFVLGRNNWRLDPANFGAQVKYAFGLGRPVQEGPTCLAASGRLPVLVPGSDGVMVVVRGTIENFCHRSVSGAAIICTLEGPGGPWTDTARPFSSAGASDLTEEHLAGRTQAAMASEVARRENSAGVVLPRSTHEFWCTFPNVAGPDSHAVRFRPSVEVTVP